MRNLLQFRTPRLLAAFAAIVGLGGCGGGQMQSNTPVPQSGNVSLSMTDAPPAGVTVISFEVSLTGATLNPGSADLLGGKGPIRIEVKRLETENAFLSTASIAPGDYTSLSLTFANPELTFKNDSGAALAGCAAGAVCEIKPSGTLTASINGTFSVGSHTQTGLLVDVNLNTLLSNALAVDFSAAGALSVTSQTKREKGELEDLDEINGIVKGPANNQFTLQTMDLGNISVSVDNNTQFKDFESCTAANFSCLSNGQSIEADLMVMAGGGFLAKKIELRDNQQEAEDDELDGVIFKVDSASQFEIVVVDELRNVNNVAVGDPVTIMLQTTGGGTSFRVDTNGLTVPSSLQQAFESATDTSQLITGQTVQVRKRSMSGGPAPAAITITTDRVRLRDTRFTATVSGAPSGNNFNIGGLPGLFVAAGVTQIQVQTSSQTNFDNVAGVSGLADGSVVSLRGLLFKSTPNPVLIADKVRKR
jgi:hypothetical protein